MRLSKNIRKLVPAFLTTVLVVASMLVGLVTPAQAEDKSQTAGETARSQPCTVGVSTIAECFANPEMAQLVAYNLGTTYDQVLTQANLELTYFSIDSPSNSLTSIEGIEMFSKLTYISINNASGLDLSPLKLLNNLTQVIILSSNISDTESLVSDLLIHLPNLDYLDLSNNHITNVQPLSRLHCNTILVRNQEITYTPLNASDNPDQSITYQRPIGKDGNRITPTSIEPDSEGNPQVTQTSVVWNNARGGTHKIEWHQEEHNDDWSSYYIFDGYIRQQVTVNTIVLALLYPSEPGSNSSPYVYRVARGHKLVRPKDPPSQSGHRFLGWYTSAQGGIKFDFDTVIRDNTALYGHWSDDPGTKPPLPTVNCQIGLSSFKTCFPDPVLAKAVVAAVNSQSGGNPVTADDPVTAEKIRSITYLFIDNDYSDAGHVENLNGIQILTNLIELYIRDKEVEVQQGNPYTPTPALDLRPISSITNLKNLTISTNRANDDSKSKYTGEYWLDDLSPLSNLTNLNTLTLDAVRLSDLNMLEPIYNLPNLDSLSLRDNNISNVIPLQHPYFKTVETIDLSDNAIGDLSPLKDSHLDKTSQLIVEGQTVIYKRGTTDPLTPIELPDPVKMNGSNIIPEAYAISPIDGAHNASTYSVIWNPPITNEEHCFRFSDDGAATRAARAGQGYRFNGRVCDKGTTADNPDRAVHRVHFDVNYDTPNPPKIDDQLVYDGDYARKPNGPIRRKYVLDHWSLDGAPFDFEHTPITRDLTLKAEWIPQYTVTFDTHGGNSIPEQTVLRNGLAVRPTDPVKAGVTFAGWFTEPDGAGEEADFSKPVTSDMTLHAKWKTPLSKLPLTGNLPWLIILPSAAAALILIGCLLYEIARRLD